MSFLTDCSSVTHLDSNNATARTTDQWQPSPPFNVSDADISMMMLAQNAIGYQKPVDDPFFSAHDLLGVLYGSDYDVSLMGCIDQYQVCNPNNPRDRGCTKLTSVAGVYRQLTNPALFLALGLNEYQITTIGRFLISGTYRNMYNSVRGRGAAALDGC
jgi:hypothetical protein